MSPGQSGCPEFAINGGLGAARRSKHSQSYCFFIFQRIKCLAAGDARPVLHVWETSLELISLANTRSVVHLNLFITYFKLFSSHTYYTIYLHGCSICGNYLLISNYVALAAIYYLANMCCTFATGSIDQKF